MRVSSDFDAGSIEVIDAGNPQHVLLAIRADAHSDYRQWFFFSAEALTPGTLHRFSLVNANQASFASAWSGYQALASYNRQHWFRLPTYYDGDGLHFQLQATSTKAWFAYFEPYPRARHNELIAQVLRHADVELVAIGQSIEGRAIELLRITRSSSPAKPKLWIIAQQHPGEHMAQWFSEGVLDQLLAPSPALQSLLVKAEIYLIANMNPDGTYRGHLRCNAAGVDLNRAWLEPCAERSPEVLFVQEQMLAHGVDLFLDIHGDEEIPFVFAAGCEGNPDFSPRLAALEALFNQNMLALGAEFQTEYGYEPELPGAADLSVACNFVGQRYDCLSLTLEMPFKDHNLSPQPLTGWSGDRARKLAGDVLTAISGLVEQLR